MKSFNIKLTKTLTILASITIITITLVGGCSQKNKSFESSTTTAPLPEDIIQAVRSSVEGKTYTVEVLDEQRVSRICTQFQVDTDPHADKNPEIARCPHEGATYKDWEPIYVNKSRACGKLPDSEFGWSVSEVSDNVWRVSNAESVWDVTKVEEAKENVGEDVVRVSVSNFLFDIKAHQRC